MQLLGLLLLRWNLSWPPSHHQKAQRSSSGLEHWANQTVVILGEMTASPTEDFPEFWMESWCSSSCLASWVLTYETWGSNSVSTHARLLWTHWISSSPSGRLCPWHSMRSGKCHTNSLFVVAISCHSCQSSAVWTLSHSCSPWASQPQSEDLPVSLLPVPPLPLRRLR